MSYLKRLCSFSTYDAAAGVQLNLALRFTDDVTLNTPKNTGITA